MTPAFEWDFKAAFDPTLYPEGLASAEGDAALG